MDYALRKVLPVSKNDDIPREERAGRKQTQMNRTKRPA